MTLKELLEAIPVRAVRGSTDGEVRGLTVDSRQVGPGFIFLALTGRQTDGHRFLEEAIERGAVAVVSEREPQGGGVVWVRTPDARRAAGSLSARLAGYPSRALDLVGVTGTNGKTTVAYLLDAVLREIAPPSVMMGTVVHRIGGESTPAPFTTPEAPEVQAFLARAVERRCRYGVMEVSSHGLALGRVEGTEFACAVFTNLSRDHLDFHRDMESYFAAKRLLFERYLRAGATGVIGIDDPFGGRLAEVVSGPLWTYGFSEGADFRIEVLGASFDGLEIKFEEAHGTWHLNSPLIGRHNALNLAAAYGAALSLGLERDSVQRALATARGAPGRYEKIETGQPFRVIVDYAHTDDALRNLLETTRALPHRKIVTVFGCGGDRDATKRPLMGAVAARLSDHIVLTSDNPRSEDPMAIIRAIELGTGGAQSRAEVVVESDRRKAIGLALSLAGPGDVVLISGKGHEAYQQISSQKIPFDDREVVKDLLAERGSPQPERRASGSETRSESEPSVERGER